MGKNSTITEVALSEATITLLATTVAKAVVGALQGTVQQDVVQSPKAATPAARSTQRRSRQVLDTSEPFQGKNIEVDFVLEPGYYLAPGEQIQWLRSHGMDISLTGELPTMGDVVAFIRDINGRNRGEGSTVTYWAKFRVSGNRTRLTSHQVRFILKNKSLRGYKPPAKV